MNEIQIFKNNEFGQIRTLVVKNEPYFVGKDVANVLGYQNPSKALIDHVDDDDKLNNESLSSLGQRGGWIINESGLYSLILSSKLPTAKKFKKWVTSEVLPSIRKSGGYIATKQDDTPESIMARAVLVAQDTLKRQKEQLDKLQADNAYKDKQIVDLTPDAEYTRKVLTSTSTFTTTQIAKEFGMSAKTLNKHLQRIGVQYKVRDQWVLSAKYQDKGLSKTTTHEFLKSDSSIGTHIQMEWTESGRKWLHDLHDEKWF